MREFRASVDAAEALGTAFEDDPEFREIIASSKRNLGAAFSTVGNHQAAETSLREAADLGLIPSNFPDRPPIQL